MMLGRAAVDTDKQLSLHIYEGCEVVKELRDEPVLLFHA